MPKDPSLSRITGSPLQHLSGSCEGMTSLMDRLLQQTFPDSASAVEYCRNACAEFGFTVKQEATANRNIYVYCSREGLADSPRNSQLTLRRKRPLKRCDCRWRIVLSENDSGQWEFRKSINLNASKHNPDLMAPDEMNNPWPKEVNDLIAELAQQQLQAPAIRDVIRQRHPDIVWDERCFYNSLAKERTRIRQRGVIERVRRLLFLSAQLCAIVAGNEEWTACVDAELSRLFDSFGQLAPWPMDTPLVDLDPERIQGVLKSVTLSKTKPVVKRLQHAISVPSYTVYVMAQPAQSASQSLPASPSNSLLPQPPQPQPSYPVGMAMEQQGVTAPFYTLNSPLSASVASSLPTFPGTDLLLPFEHGANAMTPSNPFQHGLFTPFATTIDDHQGLTTTNYPCEMQNKMMTLSNIQPSATAQNHHQVAMGMLPLDSDPMQWV